MYGNKESIKGQRFRAKRVRMFFTRGTGVGGPGIHGSNDLKIIRQTETGIVHFYRFDRLNPERLTDEYMRFTRVLNVERRERISQ